MLCRSTATLFALVLSALCISACGTGGLSSAREADVRFAAFANKTGDATLDALPYALRVELAERLAWADGISFPFHYDKGWMAPGDGKPPKDGFIEGSLVAPDRLKLVLRKADGTTAWQDEFALDDTADAADAVARALHLRVAEAGLALPLPRDRQALGEAVRLNEESAATSKVVLIRQAMSEDGWYQAQRAFAEAHAKKHADALKSADAALAQTPSLLGAKYVRAQLPVIGRIPQKLADATALHEASPRLAQFSKVFENAVVATLRNAINDLVISSFLDGERSGDGALIKLAATLGPALKSLDLEAEASLDAHVRLAIAQILSEDPAAAVTLANARRAWESDPEPKRRGAFLDLIARRQRIQSGAQATSDTPITLSESRDYLAEPPHFSARARTCTGGTALHLAAERGDLGSIADLLADGAVVQVHDLRGETPLHRAARANQLDAIRALLKASKSAVQALDDAGRTPLVSAIEVGNVEVVRLLLDNGASVSARDRSGRTPLHEAVRRGRADLVGLLLAKHADPNARDLARVSPLHLAYRLDLEAIAKQLVAAGGALDATVLADFMGNDDPEAARLFFQHRVEHPAQDKHETLLHVAVRERLVDVVRWLVGHGADRNARDGDGLRPLDRALALSHGDIVKLLVQPEDAAAWAWLGEQGPLERLIAKRPEVLRELGFDGLGVIHHAVRGGHLMMVRYLLDKGAPVELRTAGTIKHAPEVQEWTPLHFAFAAGLPAMTELLVQRGASLQATDGKGRTTWELLAISGRVPEEFRVLEKLTEAGVEAEEDLPTPGEVLVPTLEAGGIGAADYPQRLPEMDKNERHKSPLSQGRGIQIAVDLVATAVISRYDYDRSSDEYTVDRGLEPMLTRCYVASAWPEARRVARDLVAARRAPEGIDAALLAIAEQNLAVIELRLGELEKARAGFERANEALTVIAATQLATSSWLAARTDAVRAAVLENGSGVARLRGEWDRAVRELEQAKALRESGVSDVDYRPIPLLLLGLVQGERGRYRDALALTSSGYQLALSLYGPSSEVTNVARNNLGALYDALGDHAHARELALAQLEALHGLEQPDVVQLATAEANAARILRRTNEIDWATKLLNAAVDRLRKERPDHEVFGRLLLLRGEFAAAAKDHAAAAAAYDEARAALTKSYGPISGPVADAMRHQATLVAHSDPEKAHELLMEAWSITIRAETPEERWPIELALAEAAYARKSMATAIFFGKAAVTTLEAIRADARGVGVALEKSLVDSRIDVWRRLGDWLIEAGRYAEAQSVLDLLKGDEANSVVVRGAERTPRRALPNEPAKVPTTTRESELRAELDTRASEVGKLEVEVKKLEDEKREKPRERTKNALEQMRDKLREARKAFEGYLEEIEQELASMSAKRAAEVGAMNLRDLGSLKKTLQDLGHGAVLVQYLVGATKLRILLTTSETQVGRSVVIDPAKLNALMFRFRSALIDPRADPRPLGKELYDLLIGPIEQDLRDANATTLMLSLDGLTRYVPLAALWDGSAWLVERFSLALYSPSARQNLLAPPNGKNEIGAFGLAEKIDGFSELREVPFEVEGIVKRDDQDPDGVVPGKVWLDAKFSKEELETFLESGEGSMLHIASHFVFEPGTEADSYLLMGGGKRLTLEDVRYELSFEGIDILSLSACNTAIGDGTAEDPHEGRELEGFASLTQRLGAKSVVATLWPVADKSTGELMRSLYGIRAATPTKTKADALREAQLMFIKGTTQLAPEDLQPRGPRPLTGDPEPSEPPPIDRAHPYYWAPFVLMGNWL